MPKKPPLSDEEKDAFLDAMQNVKPIKPSDKHVSSPKPHRPNPKARQHASEFKSQPQWLQHMDDIPIDQQVTSDEHLQYQRSNLPHKLWQQMQRGTLSIEARLDLHQLRSDEAIETMNHFIQHCQQQGIRFALVIHGKGLSSYNNVPILKNVINQHLRAHPQVLAFLSAKPRHGGTGALYVLIKSRIPKP